MDRARPVFSFSPLRKRENGGCIPHGEAVHPPVPARGAAYPRPPQGDPQKGYSMQDKIVVKGARANNLKNIDVTIPRDKLVVMTGLSGSGKSSLAFDTIYAEGQRR